MWRVRERTMRVNFSQKAVERALRALRNIGTEPSRVEIRPDATIALCFGDQIASADNDLDRELAEWKRSRGER
jgi:hypothetical protein